MKKYLKLTFLFSVTLFAFVLFHAHQALADTVTAVSAATSTAIQIDPNAPAFGPSLLALISAIKIGALSAILTALNAVLKSDFVSGLIGGMISHTAAVWVSTIAGICLACAATLAQPGVPWYVGIVEGIISGLASSGVLAHIGAGQPASS